MKKIGVIFFILFAFQSCGDVYIPYTTSINNKANDTITVHFTGTSAYTQGIDSVICFPNTKIVYFNHEGRAVKDGCKDIGINKEEVSVVTSNERILKKNIWEVNNWECYGSKEEGWDMTFVITENDLE